MLNAQAKACGYRTIPSSSGERVSVRRNNINSDFKNLSSKAKSL